jgi:predicted house-cleaning NTP pyrophosphatase (Maf/HAM1 superfamily)
MLRSLRGRQHQVYTALALLHTSDECIWETICLTQVPMRRYSNAEIQAYVRSGDPLDKAGAYAIQHAGFHPVAALQGCYANVMGLPLCHLVVLLRQAGIEPVQPIPQACQERLAYSCPVFPEILGTQRTF